MHAVVRHCARTGSLGPEAVRRAIGGDGAGGHPALLDASYTFSWLDLAEVLAEEETGGGDEGDDGGQVVTVLVGLYVALFRYAASLPVPICLGGGTASLQI